MAAGTPWLLLDEHAPAGVLGTRVRPVDPWDEAEGSRLLCGKCGHAITVAGWSLQVAGAGEHSFVNPHGYLYRIGCFRLAPGCVPWGEEHAEYSWFPGTTWQIAHCGGCGAHLGWSFPGTDTRFHGLILDRLVQEARGAGGEG